MRRLILMSSYSSTLLRLRRPFQFQTPQSHCLCLVSTSAITEERPRSIPIPQDSLHIDHATVRLTLLSFNNDWKNALDFFNWVESHFHFHHSTDTFNLMLDILDLNWLEKCLIIVQLLIVNWRKQQTKLVAAV